MKNGYDASGAGRDGNRILIKKKREPLPVRLNRLVGKRDELIRALWRNYADTLDADRERDWNDEDMDLWKAVTDHSAIQDRLSNK